MFGRVTGENIKSRNDIELKIRKLRIIIDNLKSIGIDLTNIIDRLNSSEKELRSEIVTDDKIASISSQLNKLEKELLNYDLIYKAFSSSQVLMSLIGEDVTKTNLSKYASEMSTTLSVLKNNNYIYNKDIETIINKIYEVAYSLMKLEFFHNGNSKIYNYILKDEMSIIFINDLIKRDVDLFINSNSVDKKRMSDLITNLNICKSKGVSNTYVDSKVIINLVKLENSSVILENINKSLKEIISILEKLKDESDSLVYRADLAKDGMIRSEYKKDKKTLNRKIVTILLSLGIIGGSVAATPSISKYFTCRKLYKTVTDIYSERDGVLDSISFYGPELEEEVNRKLKVINYSSFTNEALIDTYDVSKVADIDSPQQYVSIMPEVYNIESTNESVQVGPNNRYYGKDDRQLHTTTQFKDDYIFEKDESKIEDEAFFMLLLMFIFEIAFLLTYLTYYIPSIKKMLKKRKLYSLDKKNLRAIKIEMAKINITPEIKAQFDEYVKEKAYLLEDEEALLNEVERLIDSIEKNKKLVL